jgi:diguanylate cyclase (GGDEF)-like protein
MGLLVLVIIVAIGVSLKTRGIFGSYWSYPTVLFLFFILPRRVANIYICALLAVVSAMVHSYYGPVVTIRFVMTMLLTILYSNIFVSMTGKLQGRLLEQTIIDPLTGAFNRRHMEACLSDAVERNRRNGALASLLLLDIDYFKRINDQFGHAAGDEVLKGVAALIKQRARKLDLLFRIGGEEFVLFLPDTGEDDAVTLAEQLRASIAESDLLAGQPVTVSIGVSELQVGESPGSWVNHADEGLYRAKEAGRNRVVRGSERQGESPAPLQVEPAGQAL